MNELRSGSAEVKIPQTTILGFGPFIVAAIIAAVEVLICLG